MTGAVKPAVSSTCSVVPRGNWELSSAVMVRDSSVAQFLPILLMSCGMGRPKKQRKQIIWSFQKQVV